MTEFLKYIVEQLVDDKSAVSLESTTTETNVETIVIKVAESDIGKVIGKQGKIAMALRTLVRAAGGKSGKKYIIDIAD